MNRDSIAPPPVAETFCRNVSGTGGLASIKNGIHGKRSLETAPLRSRRGKTVETARFRE